MTLRYVIRQSLGSSSVTAADSVHQRLSVIPIERLSRHFTCRMWGPSGLPPGLRLLYCTSASANGRTCRSWTLRQLKLSVNNHILIMPELTCKRTVTRVNNVVLTKRSPLPVLHLHKKVPLRHYTLRWKRGSGYVFFSFIFYWHFPIIIQRRQSYISWRGKYKLKNEHTA